MKLPRIVFSFLILSVASLASAAEPKEKSAQSEKAKRPPEWAGLFGDASLPVVWQSAVAASDKIAAALADKKVDGIPDWAETIHLAAHALPAQVKATDADKQANLADACQVAARIADDITAGAWANDVDKTNAAYQRVKTLLNIAKRSLPKEITEAPAQTPRFAKKERRDATKK